MNHEQVKTECNCEFQALFAIVASVVHLGNVQFTEDEHGLSHIEDFTPVETIVQVNLISFVSLGPINSKESNNFNE